MSSLKDSAETSAVWRTVRIQDLVHAQTWTRLLREDGSFAQFLSTLTK